MFWVAEDRHIEDLGLDTGDLDAVTEEIGEAAYLAG